MTFTTAAAVAGVAALGVLPAGAPAVPQSPRQLANAAIAAARRETGAHWILTGTSKQGRMRFVTEAGQHSGEQQVFVSFGTPAQHDAITARYRVELHGSTLELDGDAQALQVAAGFSVAASRREAGRWVALPRTSPAYASLAVGLSVPSLAANIALRGAVTEGRRTVVDGIPVIPLRGTTAPSPGSPASREILYVRAEGAPLPVLAVQPDTSSPASFRLTAALHITAWGRIPVVPAPARVVAYSPSWLAAPGRS